MEKKFEDNWGDVLLVEQFGRYVYLTAEESDAPAELVFDPKRAREVAMAILDAAERGGR
jgi:hypothetical protein